MDRADIPELHYITDIANLGSILDKGILSHRRAKNVPHESIAMEEIQKRRARVTLPTGRKLHDYANLYVHARNPMMYKRKALRDKLCVLRIKPSVLDLPGVVIATGNAASDFIQFLGVEPGIAALEKDLVFAEYWTHQDLYEGFRRTVARSAEVLVPDVVKPEYIEGAYVHSNKCSAYGFCVDASLTATVDAHLFFG